MKKSMKKIMTTLTSLVLASLMLLNPVAAYAATESSAQDTQMVRRDIRVMHRLYNKSSGEHFYTANNKERQNLMLQGWKYEGIAWMAPTAGKPVHRLYNILRNAQSHGRRIMKRDNYPDGRMYAIIADDYCGIQVWFDPAEEHITLDLVAEW